MRHSRLVPTWDVAWVHKIEVHNYHIILKHEGMECMECMEGLEGMENMHGSEVIKVIKSLGNTHVGNKLGHQRHTCINICTLLCPAKIRIEMRCDATFSSGQSISHPTQNLRKQNRNTKVRKYEKYEDRIWSYPILGLSSEHIVTSPRLIFISRFELLVCCTKILVIHTDGAHIEVSNIEEVCIDVGYLRLPDAHLCSLMILTLRKHAYP